LKKILLKKFVRSYYMDIACSDLIKKRILEEILNKEAALNESYMDVKKTAIENKFFASVLDDYEQYYEYIKKDKIKQIVVLEEIAEHLDKLIMNTSVLNERASNLKNDQKMIIEKLTTVRHELNELTK
jgi:hypothetical protein